ncbi:MAG: transaldolase family protein [Desulfovibrionales bacterium]
MRPDALKTRIFLDGGDPDETREILNLLGFLDGQTTNPTLISRHPKAKTRLEQGKKFQEEELLDFYREVVQELSSMIPDGSISVEVYADPLTKAEAMLVMGEEMFSWIPNAHVKFPSSHEGFHAAEQAVKRGLRVNMTLCFRQEQAAATYAATRGAGPGDVFVSPFIGRLDDRGQNGMDLIANSIRMFQEDGDGHVKVLTASVRTYEHLFYALKLGSDIITAPYALLKKWGEEGMPMPGEDFRYEAQGLDPIAYKDLALNSRWQEFNIHHDLTTQGMEKFSADWNSLIQEEK